MTVVVGSPAVTAFWQVRFVSINDLGISLPPSVAEMGPEAWRGAHLWKGEKLSRSTDYQLLRMQM